MIGGPNAVKTAVTSQMWLFAEFTPFLGKALALVGVQRKAGAMATPEQQKSEHEESRREFLCFRPPKGFLNGCSRATWNVAIGSVGVPALFLASSLSGLIHGGPPGLVVGVVSGAFYSSVWCVMGYASAGLQVAEGVANTLSSPIQQAAFGKRWDPLKGRWVKYSTASDAYLALFENSDEIWLAAIRRHAERFGTVDNKASLSATDDGQSYYDLLGIQQDASEKEVKDAYKKMAKHLHPDRNPNPEARAQFEEVTQAYKILSDPAARKRYDAGGVKALKQKGEQTKREALRGVFGGQKLTNIVGDVRTSRFSRRMLEDAYMMHEENLVIIGRQREDLIKNLLELLEGHPGRASMSASCRPTTKKSKSELKFSDNAAEYDEPEEAAGEKKSPSKKSRNPLGDSSASSGSRGNCSKTTGDNEFSIWHEKAAKLVKEAASLGMAREVMYVVGHEYDACHQFALGNPLATRSLMLFKNTIKLAQTRIAQGKLGVNMILSSSKLRNDPEFVLDAVWKLSVPELEATARFVCLSILLDETANAAERQRRADAIADLSGLFLEVGQKYDKASPAVIQKLKDAVMKERQRKNQEQYGAGSANQQ